MQFHTVSGKLVNWQSLWHRVCALESRVYFRREESLCPSCRDWRPARTESARFPVKHDLDIEKYKKFRGALWKRRLTLKFRSKNRFEGKKICNLIYKFGQTVETGAFGCSRKTTIRQIDAHQMTSHDVPDGVGQKSVNYKSVDYKWMTMSRLPHASTAVVDGEQRRIAIRY